MEYQETGRFGRITKSLRINGFEAEMPEILYDSINFTNLNKKGQTQYLECVMERMIDKLGQANTNKVLFSCGEQCCGKSWANFAKRIWANSDNSIDKFVTNMNIEEEKYHTFVSYDSKNNSIIVNRKKCICGLINKGNPFETNKSFCNCSIGHMSAFFKAIFKVEEIILSKSIMNGDYNCEWKIKLGNV